MNMEYLFINSTLNQIHDVDYHETFSHVHLASFSVLIAFFYFTLNSWSTRYGYEDNIFNCDLSIFKEKKTHEPSWKIYYSMKGTCSLLPSSFFLMVPSMQQLHGMLKWMLTYVQLVFFVEMTSSTTHLVCKHTLLWACECFKSVYFMNHICLCIEWNG